MVVLVWGRHFSKGLPQRFYIEYWIVAKAPLPLGLGEDLTLANTLRFQGNGAVGAS
jgi:hypothetical protein